MRKNRSGESTVNSVLKKRKRRQRREEKEEIYEGNKKKTGQGR